MIFQHQRSLAPERFSFLYQNASVSFLYFDIAVEAVVLSTLTAALSDPDPTINCQPRPALPSMSRCNLEIVESFSFFHLPGFDSQDSL
jgi:hypothetical protein